MMKQTPYGVGVFLPVGNGGWILSRDSPRVDGSYALNRRVTLMAEEMGMDYAIAMAKWRGYGGDTRHWDDTMESLTMCCGLAEATSRIDLYCTIHTSVFNPFAVAKMMTTFDHISGGRAGMNIVAKSHNPEVAQMGIPAGDESRRYDHAREWLDIIKRLWTEDHVTVKGDFFEVEDAMCNPKPLRTPRPPLICAGLSDIGRVFTIEEADACLISANDHDGLKERSIHVHEIASGLGRTTNTLALLMVVPGKTRAEAFARIERYNRAADREALEMLARSTYGLKGAASLAALARSGQAVGMMSGYPMTGTAEDIIAGLTDLFETGEVNGIVLTVPDFIDDMEWFGEKVLPTIEARGYTRGLLV